MPAFAIRTNNVIIVENLILEVVILTSIRLYGQKLYVGDLR